LIKTDNTERSTRN